MHSVNNHLQIHKRMNKWRAHFSNCVVELSGANDHLHLKDVPFRHALLNQILQHLLLVQPNRSEKKKKTAGVWENTALCIYNKKKEMSCAFFTAVAPLTWNCLWGLKHQASTTLGSKSWLPDCEERKGKLQLSLSSVVIRVRSRWARGNWRRSQVAATWWVSCADPSRKRLRSHCTEYQTPGRNYLPSAFWQTRQNSPLTKNDLVKGMWTISLQNVICIFKYLK